MLLKTALKRAFPSFFIGIGISQLINLTISLGEGNGVYLSVMPAFAARFSSNLTAVVAQALLIGLLSAVFAMASVFFMIERWSFLRQCAAHFAVTAAVWIPVVLIVWSPKGQPGLVILPVSFLFTYFVVWLTQIILNRRLVRRINDRLTRKEDSDERH